MLQQIMALSHDPDAAELVQSGRQLAAALNPLLALSQQAISQQELDESPELPGLLLSSLLMPLMQQHNLQPNGQRPCRERVLNRLPKTVLDAAEIARLRRNDGEAVCAICYDEYDVGQRVMKLPCDHLFCVGCCLQWLRRTGTCPVCRSSVMDDERSDDEDGWHSADLFPYRRLPRGSAMAVVRSVREVQGEELWPPVEDMAAIAQQHSSVQGTEQEVMPAARLGEVHQAVLPTGDAALGSGNQNAQVNRGDPAEAILPVSRTQHSTSQLLGPNQANTRDTNEMLASGGHDSPASGLTSNQPPRDEAPVGRSQRQRPVPVPASVGARPSGNMQARPRLPRGQAQSLPRVAASVQAPTPVIRTMSNVHRAGTGTSLSRQTDVHRQRGSAGLQR